MRWDIIIALTDNAILLLGLLVIYEVTSLVASSHRRLQPVINGILISIICVAIMNRAYTIQPGMIFDTRSIIISVTALIFGVIPTAITVAIASIFRISIGGVGMITGLAEIFTSAAIGLAWRKWLYPKAMKWYWLNIYSMSICVHIIFLMCSLLLPYPDNLKIIREIAIPVMLIYPIVSVLLSLLLRHKQTLLFTQNQLSESERSKSILISNLPGLAYRCNYDKQWTMTFVSNGCFNLTGYKPCSILHNRDLSYQDLIAPEYGSCLRKEWEQILVNKRTFKYEYEIITATGKRKWVMEMGQGIYNEKGEVEALEGIILDISEKKQVESDLRYINEHDSLTGLYNRDYLEILIQKDNNKNEYSKRALISINISTVQLLTANYGFHYTQNLIKRAAESLNQHSTDKRILFQTYENRFVFYLKDYVDKNELIYFSEVIVNAMESVFVTDKISGGIGVIEIEQDNYINVDMLLTKLLISSEMAINIYGKDFTTCFYNESLEAKVNREWEIRQELSRIAETNSDDELYLQFQPIMDVKTNSICAFEALARLRTETLGLVSPMEFIPIAEKTKLIIPIGEKIIINAFHFLNRLRDHGYETISVSINVSAIQLLRRDFTQRLFEIINEMGVNPSNVSIEITESVFASNYDNINNILGELRDYGIHIDIDDFGTGYSSLSRVKELRVDGLKIDKSFIDMILESDFDTSITSDIISMSQKLGHFTIAEGVEYESQLKYLRKHNCDKIQGYLISRPLDEEVALKFLRDRENSNLHNSKLKL